MAPRAIPFTPHVSLKARRPASPSRVPPDQSSTSAAAALERGVRVAGAQLAGDARAPRADREHLDLGASRHGGVREAHQRPGVGLHRAGHVAQQHDAGGAGGPAARWTVRSGSPPVRSARRDVARRSIAPRGDGWPAGVATGGARRRPAGRPSAGAPRRAPPRCTPAKSLSGSTSPSLQRTRHRRAVARASPSCTVDAVVLVGVEQHGDLLLRPPRARRHRWPRGLHRRWRRTPGRRWTRPRAGGRGWPARPSRRGPRWSDAHLGQGGGEGHGGVGRRRHARGAASVRAIATATALDVGGHQAPRCTAASTSAATPLLRTRSWSSRYLRTVPSVAVTVARRAWCARGRSSASAQSIVSATPGGLYSPSARRPSTAAATWRARRSGTLGRAQSHDGHLPLEVGVLDPVVEAAPLERVVEVARAVRGDDHDRRDLGRGSVPSSGTVIDHSAEHLEEEGLELVVGPVELVDQQDRRRRAVCGRDGLQQGPAHEEPLGVELALESVRRSGRCVARRPRPPAGAAAGGRGPTRRRSGRRRGPRSTGCGSARRRSTGPASWPPRSCRRRPRPRAGAGRCSRRARNTAVARPSSVR